ncbi:MAG: molybdenum cofactor biosynthesis protein MoaB [Desulfobacteraceae bacterium]|nr:MAG: molybdenum cofactor biosynthesis protein MoaB [Desulfobacteraceae bacterium]
MGHHEHRAHAPRSIRVAVLSVSSTRTLDADESGHWIAKQAAREGHRVVAHEVVTDAITPIRNAVALMLTDAAAEALIITGGTGITPKDVTIEAVRPLLDKELTAFGPIFAQLSFEQIDTAALLSRSTAGVIGRCLVFCLPGSLKACRLACKALIFPELGHMIGHVTADH